MENEDFRYEPAVYYDHVKQKYIVSKYYESWLYHLSDESITEFLNRLTEDVYDEINITKKLRGVIEDEC